MGHSIGNAIQGLVLVGSALVLAACGGGGGGGSSGGGADIPENSYRVSLTASRDQLPLNLNQNYCENPPSAWAPNAATVFIEAKRRLTGDPILGGDNVFACNIASGLESGALYYFLGRDEDKVEIACPDGDREVEGAYRNITMGANAGGNSFHILSSDVVGEVLVRCTATDPVSGQTATGERRIQVGGVSSGLASQIAYSTVGQNFLFVQGLGGPTQLIYQVRVVDEAGQPVPNPPAGTANLLARIIPNPASLSDNNALLRSGGQSGKSVAVSTINGQAQFTVVSGSAPGVIGVEFFADRADGNVQNGISDPVVNAIGVPVVVAVASTALAIETEELPDAFLATPYAQIIAASGGVPPYTFGLGSGTSLPNGLGLSSNGVIVGTPTVSGGNFGFIVTVTDALGTQVALPYTLNVNEKGGLDVPLSILTTALPTGTFGEPYTAILQAQGGTPPYVWSEVGSNAGGFVVSGTGIGSVTAAAAPPAGTYSVVVRLVASGGTTAARTYTIVVNEP